MNNTIFNHEISQQIQQERIDVLNETIDIMDRIIKIDKEHKQHLNETISNQAEQLKVAYTRIELGKQTESINADTIAKLFAAAKKDKETINNYLKSKSNE